MESSQHQEMPNSTLENMLVCSKAAQDKKPRPNPEHAQKCPRCDSTNTKFCYYNNYSLTQPRYFCKGCRRYWTKGGTLRNVPVGGGCRKNKRSSIKRTQDQPNQNPGISGIPQLSYYDSSDLSLAFARLQKGNNNLGFDEHEMGNFIASSNSNPVFIDRYGLVGTNPNFQNLYYGFGNGNLDDCAREEEFMMQESVPASTTAATTVTAMKQEMTDNVNRDSVIMDQSRVLMGFPWQMNGGDGGIMGESWNGGFNSSWHGLLNSPLM